MPGVDDFGAQVSDNSMAMQMTTVGVGVRKPPRSNFPSETHNLIKSYGGRITVGSKRQALHMPEAVKPSIA